tara:strand:- start:281 stop:457 length:177 start_codon:yes stop_codon:yes gene_type:complete
MNINEINEKKIEMEMNPESSPLAEFFELCIQSGLQFENSARANLLDKAIDYCIEKGMI